MKQNEINELIEFSPSNLTDFFDNSIEIIEAGVPKFGTLNNEPTF